MGEIDNRPQLLFGINLRGGKGSLVKRCSKTVIFPFSRKITAVKLVGPGFQKHGSFLQIVDRRYNAHLSCCPDTSKYYHGDNPTRRDQLQPSNFPQPESRSRPGVGWDCPG